MTSKWLKRSFFVVFAFLLTFLVEKSETALTLNSFLSETDLKLFRDVFNSALKSDKELSSLFYGAGGLKFLGEKVSESNKICELAKKLLKEDDLESLYFAGGLATTLENCKFTLSKAQQTVSNAISDPKASAQNLYYATFAAKRLSLKVDDAKISAALTTALKKDDSAGNLSYIFHASSLLKEVPLDSFFNKIEDCVAQADEIDKKYLQFDGGLSATAFVITAIYSLAEKVQKAPAIKPEEAVKLANLLLNRKGVKLPRPAYHILNALTVFTTNQYHVPVVFTLASPVSVSSKSPDVKIRVTDVLGKSVGALTVTADSAVHIKSKAVVINKKQLKADKDNKLYSLNFMETTIDSGFYKILISATSSASKKLIGTQEAELTVKVTTEITVENVQLAVLDRDQTMTVDNAQKVASFSKVPNVLDADTHQKLVMKFTVKDKSANAATKVHQAFVYFIHVKTGREIVFIAEADSSKIYKFDVDLLKSAKDFEFLSGKYVMKLILGDAVVNNPIEWLVADVNLKFPEQSTPEKSTVEHISYEVKPEIVHMFRQPEKRPSGLVSDTFTILVLVPLLVMFVLWFRIGANISNFSFSLNTVGFHLGLAGIFGLYFVFWLQLNMFQTLKYLTAIGCFTFLTGNRMLRSMAEKRKTKTE